MSEGNDKYASATEPCHDCGAMIPLAQYAAHVRSHSPSPAPEQEKPQADETTEMVMTALASQPNWGPHMDSVREALDKPPQAAECAWKCDDADGDSIWETSCGHAFQWNDGGPSDNGAKFCCYCGKALREVLTSQSEEDDE